MTDSSSSHSSGAPFEPPTPDELNAILEQYEFIDILGRGGMGAVYKARQISLDRLVAIKILPANLVSEDEEDELQFASRFQREARAMAKMGHPNIIGVYDFGLTQDDQLYIVMEYVEGSDLYKLIQTGGLTTDHVVGWISQICEALQYAHDQGVVHRDIKPANIMINAAGDVKIADFGLAKLTDAESNEPNLTMTNVAMGTPDYVAPEALDSTATVDHRADLYAVGVMLYEMLTGKIPRGAWKSPCSLVEGLDPRFDEVVVKAMDSDPDGRFQNATEIRSSIYDISTTPLESADAEVKLGEPHSPASRLKFDDVTHFDRMPKAPVPQKRSRKRLIGGLVSAVAFAMVGAIFVLPKGPGEEPSNEGAGMSKSEGRMIPDSPEKASIAQAEKVIPDEAASGSGMATVLLPALPESVAFSTKTSRYELVPARVSWEEARDGAAGKGGRLAVFASAEEFEELVDSLKGTIGSDAGILLGAQFANGEVRWVDGSKAPASDFAALLPSEKVAFNGPLIVVPSPMRWEVLSPSSPSRKFSPAGYLVEWEIEVPAEPESMEVTLTPMEAKEDPSKVTPEKVDKEEAAPEMAETDEGKPEEAVDLDPHLEKLRKGFEARYESDVEQPYQASLQKLREGYLSRGLARARASARDNGDIEAINAIESAKALMESTGDVLAEADSSLPESLQTLNDIFRKSHAQLKQERDSRAAPLYSIYTGALDDYIAELTRKNEIEKARDVLVMRNSIAEKDQSTSVSLKGLDSDPNVQSLSNQSEHTDNGGSLFAFSNVTLAGTNEINTEEAEGYSDFVSVVLLGYGNWAAIRSNGRVVSNLDEYNRLRGVREIVRSGHVFYENGNFESVRDGIGQEIKPIRDVVKVTSGFNYGVVQTADGSLHSYGQIAPVPEEIDSVRLMAGLWANNAMVIDQDGNPHVWGESKERFAPPENLNDVVSVNGGWHSFFALRGDGSVIAWPDTPIPANLPPFVTIKAKAAIYAGQKSDLSWTAFGGSEMGIRDKINEIGPALDLDFEANGRGFGYLIWISADSEDISAGDVR